MCRQCTGRGKRGGGGGGQGAQWWESWAACCKISAILGGSRARDFNPFLDKGDFMKQNPPLSEGGRETA